MGNVALHAEQKVASHQGRPAACVGAWRLLQSSMGIGWAWLQVVVSDQHPWLGEHHNVSHALTLPRVRHWTWKRAADQFVKADPSIHMDIRRTKHTLASSLAGAACNGPETDWKQEETNKVKRRTHEGGITESFDHATNSVCEARVGRELCAGWLHYPLPGCTLRGHSATHRTKP